MKVTRPSPNHGSNPLQVLVECSLGPRVVRVKAVDDEASNRKASIAESSSELSESDRKLYYTSSSSLVYSLSEESGGEESSD